MVELNSDPIVEQIRPMNMTIVFDQRLLTAKRHLYDLVILYTKRLNL